MCLAITRRTITVCLVLIIGTAVALRCWGIAAGLPYLFHPDEPRYVTIIQSVVKGDLNPHFFNYPSLFIYLHALLYLPYYGVGMLLGHFTSLVDIVAPQILTMGTGYTSMPATFMVGRGLSVALGTLTVLLVFAIGRQVAGDAAGLLAALMLAVAAPHIEHSRYITPDVLLVFCVMLAVWSYIRVWRSGTTGHYLAAGVASGLVVGAKYNGALIISALLVAHWLRWGWRGIRDWRLYAALALGALTFLITTPFAVLDRHAFWTDLRFEAHHYATGHAGMEGDAFRWYLQHLWQVTGPLWVLALFELVRGVWRRNGMTLLLGTFPAIYFCFISTFAVRNDRTALPLLPFIFLLAASHLMWLAQVYHQRFPRPVPQIVAAVLAALSLVVPVTHLSSAAPPTERLAAHRAARAWIEQHLPPSTTLVLEPYAPYIDPQHFNVQSVGRMIDHESQWYVDNGAEYLVYSEPMYGRFFKNRQRYQDESSAYDVLFSAFEEAAVFPAAGGEIRIYRVRPAVAQDADSMVHRSASQVTSR